ncbi:MAG: hypothetical protein BZY75_01930 [SAR202 cluster bacterium Io17-Chloro-G7]|nr:MAG: hypothetical protein BZY75_01930 [SAR202 cluster bacterium Io17-Chloro-G7]
MPQLAIVLPTYNEAQNLGPLVRGLENLGLDFQLLIVDDNSSDGTRELAGELAETYKNITVIKRPGKSGLGSALRTGLTAALATDAQYVVTMDADQSHDPLEVPRLLAGLTPGLKIGPTNEVDARPDLVQGSRYIAGGGITGMTAFRRFSSHLANLIYHWCARGPQECTNNFRVYSRRAAALVVERSKGDHYEFVPEATLIILAAGLNVAEVPTIFKCRVTGSSKLGAMQAIRGIAALFSTTIQYKLAMGRFSRRPYEGGPPSS